MAKKPTEISIPDEIVMNKIFIIRGQKVMLDSDLAELYQTETGQLKRQVKRNVERFPEDFMFELTKEEYEVLRSQIGILKRGTHSKFLPMVFTEQGVAMLSSVLNSSKAIQVNIRIMRIFTRIRQMLSDNTELRLAIQNIERKTDGNSKSIELLFEYMAELTEKKEEKPKQKPRRQIGFNPKKK